MGVTSQTPPVAGGWVADPAHWADLRRRLAEAVTAHAQRDPLAIGMPPEAARAVLGLPDRALVEALARVPADPGSPATVELNGGYLRMVTQPSPDQDPQPGPVAPAGARAAGVRGRRRARRAR